MAYVINIPGSISLKVAKARHANDIAKLSKVGFIGCSLEEYQEASDNGEDVGMRSPLMVHWNDLPDITKKHYFDKG